MVYTILAWHSHWLEYEGDGAEPERLDLWILVFFVFTQQGVGAGPGPSLRLTSCRC